MDKADFRNLLVQVVEEARCEAEREWKRPLPNISMFEVHAPDSSGRIVQLNEAVDLIYISERSFYRIIDIAITRRRGDHHRAFVRVGGHAPVEFGETWDPSKFGPFKLLVTE